MSAEQKPKFVVSRSKTCLRVHYVIGLVLFDLQGNCRACSGHCPCFWNFPSKRAVISKNNELSEMEDAKEHLRSSHRMLNLRLFMIQRFQNFRNSRSSLSKKKYPRKRIRLLSLIFCIIVLFLWRKKEDKYASQIERAVRNYVVINKNTNSKKSYLPPPLVLTRSPDACGDALGVRKVALMFLTTGNLYHEDTWRLWFESAKGFIPVLQAGELACANPEHPPDSVLEQKLNACMEKSGSVDESTAESSVTSKSHGDSTMDSDSAATSNVLDSQHLFSVYVHAPPKFRGYSRDSLFYGKLIEDRIETAWGSHNLVEATRNLIWEAYKDPLNSHFVLLSESDIPLYDPLTFWQQLQADNASRINTCTDRDISPWRWDPLMEIPNVLNSTHWRKSSQWIMLTRAHAKVVLEDVEIYRKFEEHCWSAWDKSRGRWYKDCFSDEHYFPTLFAAKGLDNGVCESGGIAYTDWSIPNSAHPRSFEASKINSTLIITAREADYNILEGRKYAQNTKCDWKTAQTQGSQMFLQKSDLPMLENRKSKVAERLENEIAEATHVGKVSSPSLYKENESCSKFIYHNSTDGKYTLPHTCFLTARKFPSGSKSAVKNLFLRCGNVHLLHKDLCISEDDYVPCRSWFMKLVNIFKSTCSPVRKSE